MRQFIVKPRAQNVINGVAQFIDSQNLPGSGEKWVEKIFDFMHSHSQLNIEYSLCHNAKLAERKFFCIIFDKKWVITFKQTETRFTVYQVIWGANLR